jgi:hypothetical protein
MYQFGDNYYQKRLNRSKSQRPVNNTSILTDDNRYEKNESHVFSNNNSYDKTKKKSLILSEKDLVILTPIGKKEDLTKINRLNQHICNRCYHRLNKKIIYDHINQDVKLFGFIFQLFISLFVIMLFFINIFLTLVNTFTSVINYNGYSLTLKKCHITLLVLNVCIINIISLILLGFDLKQSKKLASYRLSNNLFILIEWAGGWIIKWIFMVYLYITKKTNTVYFNQRFSYLQLSITTLLSIVGPFAYFIFISNLND